MKGISKQIIDEEETLFSSDDGYNKLKVVRFGLQSRVLDEMKKPGFSATQLAKKLVKEGYDISAQNIRVFIKKCRDAQRQVIAKDKKATQEIVELTEDYKKALKSLIQEIEEVKNTAKDDKDLTTYNQLIGRLFQGIELVAKLTGEIKPKQNFDVKIFYENIYNDVERRMKKERKTLFNLDNVIDVEAEIKEDNKTEKGE